MSVAVGIVGSGAVDCTIMEAWLRQLMPTGEIRRIQPNDIPATVTHGGQKILMVLGYRQGDASSVDVVQQCRALSPSNPIVVFTDNDNPIVMEQLRQAGANWVSPRPTNKQVLVETLKDAVGSILQ